MPSSELPQLDLHVARSRGIRVDLGGPGRAQLAQLLRDMAVAVDAAADDELVARLDTQTVGSAADVGMRITVQLEVPIDAVRP